MSTLNGGFTHGDKSSKNISDEDRALINEHIRTKGIIECPPAGVQGNEVTPITHERIMQKRKEYRAAQRAKAKANK